MPDAAFYKNKRVLVTGHTGFKGTWLCKLLLTMGAQVTGYALSPLTNPSLFALAGLEGEMCSLLGDVRDLEGMRAAFEQAQPELVFHLAAQPIVRESYKNPVDTYATNVMGTVHLLDCVRGCGSVRSVVNVTTDKVYRNNEWAWGYREEDVLDGFDPYSNSKACSELVTASYKRSFFADGAVAVSTVRAGNVIGGGDFAADRIVPDCVRAAQQSRPIVVRNPHSIRPYQFVLEPLFAYLTLAQRQCGDGALAGSYNVGPDDSGCVTTGTLVQLFCNAWGGGLTWQTTAESGVHEANFLKLDCSKLKANLGWRPQGTAQTALEKTVEGYKAILRGDAPGRIMEQQIAEYERSNRGSSNV